MRILLLTPEYLPNTGGGIVTFYRHLLPEMVKAGHSVRVVQGSGVYAPAEQVKTTIDGVEVETLEIGRLRKQQQRFSHLDAMPGLRNCLAAAWAMWEQAGCGEDADIVEACDWGLLFVPSVIEGRKPLIAQLHGSCGQIDARDPIAGEEAQGILVRLIESVALKRACGVQTYSTANASFWREQQSIEVARIPPAWRPLPVAATALSPSEHGLVLGRVQHWKGPHVLCQAMGLLAGKPPAIEWIGRDTADGERGISLSASLARDYPQIWGSRILHRGPVPPEEAQARQFCARFNVVPSTWDVFNFTCVEAMASGRPVICSMGAGAAELIEDGINGFTFASGDAPGLARALERVMAMSKAEMGAMGRAAQETVRTELAPATIAARRLSAYADAISSFVPRPPAAGDWLLQACSGRDGATKGLAFLDHLPLRDLVSHSTRRMRDKLLGGKRG